MKNFSFIKDIKIKVLSLSLIVVSFLVAGLPWFFSAFEKTEFTEFTFTPARYKSSLDKQSIEIFSDSSKLLTFLNLYRLANHKLHYKF